MVVELDMLKSSIADLKELLKSLSGNEKRDRGMGERRCWTCGESGHISRFCRQRDQHCFADRRCFSCGDFGHIQRFCTQRKPYMVHKRCFGCGELGHIQRMCGKGEHRIDLDGIVSCSDSHDFGKTSMAWKSGSGHEMSGQKTTWREKSDGVERVEGRHGERRVTTWREKRDDMERED